MRIKIVLYYILEFILSIFILLLFSVAFLKFTVLDSNYILKQLKKNNYYSELYKSINDEMSNYIIQAGLEEEVLKDIYTEEMVVEEVNQAINSFYKNKKIEVDTIKVKDKLEANIVTYLEKNNIKVTDQASLDRFVNQILEVYEEKIILSSALTSVSPKIVKINHLMNMILILLSILCIPIALIIFLKLKKEALAVPFFMTGILISVTNYLLFSKIDVKHILFWNDNISSIIKSILYDLSSIMKISACIFIIMGIICCILLDKTKKKKE